MISTRWLAILNQGCSHSYNFRAQNEYLIHYQREASRVQ